MSKRDGKFTLSQVYLNLSLTNTRFDVVANSIQMKQLETPVNHGQTIANDPTMMNLILIVMKNFWLHARDARSTLKCLSW